MCFDVLISTTNMLKTQNWDVMMCDAKIENAISYLADRCDWAFSSDGCGFSSSDAPLGHALAKKNIWSAAERYAALSLVQRYQKQLRSAGIFDIDSMLEILKKSEKPIRRLGKRDVVSGTVDVKADKSGIRKFIIKTSYHDDVKYFLKNKLICSCWIPDEKVWSAELCKENADDLTNLATKYGLTLNKSKDWDSLIGVREAKLSDDAEYLIVRGFSRNSVSDLIGSQTGDPEKDENMFSALQWEDRSTFSVRLTTWNIEKMSLWLADENVSTTLAPVKDKIQFLLSATYTQAHEKEKIYSGMSAALNISQENRQVLAALIPKPLSDAFMPHQWVALEMLVNKSQCILADQQGLGKTIEVLAALEINNSWPVIIICPSIARLSWRDEISEWLPHRSVHVNGMTKKDTGTVLEDAEIIIVNYESFGKFSLTEHFPAATSIVCDEAQYLKTHDSQRTQGVKEYLSLLRNRSSGLKKTYLTTGTPIMNRPSELLTLLTLVPGLLSALGGFYFYAARYCRATLNNYYGWNYSGSGNLSELNSRLIASGCYMRREKNSVLSDLPDKLIDLVFCGISNRVEYDQAYSDFSEWLKTKNINSDNILDSDKEDEDASVSRIMGIANLYPLYRNEALKQIGVLRSLAGTGKAEAACEWISNNVKDEKLVVFAYHIETQRLIQERFEGALFISGDQSPAARASAIRSFQKDPSTKVIVCSLKAAQTAITLTAARKALIVELDWTPTTLEQAEDRLHRITQTGQVEITYMVAENTLDDKMRGILDIKRLIVKKIVATAVFGYKKDGAARLQTPGPGRPRISPEDRAARKKLAQKSWQERNLEYMRKYMQIKRASQK